jgi:antitoxin component YwqK of YwqJK toxin-antitoxin module
MGNKILRIDQYWDENNVEKVTKGEGLYFEESGKLSLTGTLKDGLKDGIWIGKDDGFQLSFTENYENGMLISGVSKDANGIERNYTQLEERPTVKRGIHHFYKFVAENFKIKNNIPLKGNLLVTFTITEDGSLSNIHIFKGIHFLIDKEAIRVLQSYPSWNPGKYRGVNTRAQHNLPIAISGN